MGAPGTNIPSNRPADRPDHPAPPVDQPARPSDTGRSDAPLPSSSDLSKMSDADLSKLVGQFLESGMTAGEIADALGKDRASLFPQLTDLNQDQAKLTAQLDQADAGNAYNKAQNNIKEGIRKDQIETRQADQDTVKSKEEGRQENQRRANDAKLAQHDNDQKTRDKSEALRQLQLGRRHDTSESSRNARTRDIPTQLSQAQQKLGGEKAANNRALLAQKLTNNNPKAKAAVENYLHLEQKQALLKQALGQAKEGSPLHQKLTKQMQTLEGQIAKARAQVEKALKGSKEEVPPALMASLDQAVNKSRKEARLFKDSDDAKEGEGEGESSSTTTASKKGAANPDRVAGAQQEQGGTGEQGGGSKDHSAGNQASQAPVMAQAVSLQEAVERRGVTILGTSRDNPDEAVQLSSWRCLATMEEGAKHAMCAEEGTGQKGLVGKLRERHRGLKPGGHSLDDAPLDEEGDVLLVNSEQGGFAYYRDPKTGKITDAYKAGPGGAHEEKLSPKVIAKIQQDAGMRRHMMSLNSNAYGVPAMC